MKSTQKCITEMYLCSFFHTQVYPQDALVKSSFSGEVQLHADHQVLSDTIFMCYTLPTTFVSYGGNLR